MHSTEASAGATGTPPRSGPMGPNGRPFHSMAHEPSLEGLRGVAAFTVATAHINMIVIPEQLRQPTWFPGAFVFMDMFFVMSGFLITMVLLRERVRTGRINILEFYRRRALRLIPALWVMLGVYVIFVWIAGAEEFGGWTIIRGSVISGLFYGLNFRMTSVFAPVAQGLSHLWSLGLEEQFYLVWPLLVITLLPLKRSLWMVTLILGSGIAVITWMRLQMVANGTNFMVMYTHPQSRGDSFLMGGLVAFFWAHGKLPSDTVIKAGAWIGAIAMTIYLFMGDQMSMFNPRFGYPLAGVSFAFMMVAAMQTDWAGKHVLEWRPLVFTGRITYSLYVWHVPILMGVHRYAASWMSGLAGSVARTIVAVVLLLGAAILSYEFIEKPILAFRDRKPSKRGTDREAETPGAT